MLNPTNFQSQAYESIKELILTAKLIPGQKISEKELEQRLTIGRTPIREAIIRLRREALSFPKAAPIFLKSVSNKLKKLVLSERRLKKKYS